MTKTADLSSRGDGRFALASNDAGPTAAPATPVENIAPDIAA